MLRWAICTTQFVPGFLCAKDTTEAPFCLAAMAGPWPHEVTPWGVMWGSALIPTVSSRAPSEHHLRSYICGSFRCSSEWYHPVKISQNIYFRNKLELYIQYKGCGWISTVYIQNSSVSAEALGQIFYLQLVWSWGCEAVFHVRDLARNASEILR